jgi:tetratricopeptide (TPR) repeat protein
VIPIFPLAAYYHRRAIRTADATENPVVMGLARLGAGMHEDALARFDQALEYYEYSAATLREAGYLRGWGACTSQMAWASYQRVGFAQCLEKARELVQVGQETADRQVWAWGLLAEGLVKRCTGPVDEAISDFRGAIALFEAAADYADVAQASGQLGMTYTRQRKFDDALQILENVAGMVAERKLRGIAIVSAPLALADAYLAVAEEARGGRRAELLKKARQACRAARRHAGAWRCWLPTAYRLQGTYEWLQCNPSAARRWWRQSILVAEELCLPHQLGLTFLEIGRRTDDAGSLIRAESILSQIGATLDLEEARQLLLCATRT